MTPLSHAAANGHLDVVKFMVNEADRKADVESKDLSQKTPLSQAAWNGHLEVVKFLVNEADPKADVESKDDWGQTPLSLAAEMGHLETVKFLVNEAGADITSKDDDGEAALDLARREAAKESWRSEGCRAVVAWLESRIPNRGSRANFNVNDGG